MIYTTGTVNTVSGSAIVKGTGTKFKNNNPAINIGMTILIKSGNTNIPYMIKSVNSDTELVLAQPALATATNATFSIHITEPDNNSDAARTMVAINSYVEYFLDAMNTWMTQTGQTKIEMPNGEVVTLDSIKKMQEDISSKANTKTVEKMQVDIDDKVNSSELGTAAKLNSYHGEYLRKDEFSQLAYQSFFDFRENASHAVIEKYPFGVSSGLDDAKKYGQSGYCGLLTARNWWNESAIESFFQIISIGGSGNIGHRVRAQNENWLDSVIWHLTEKNTTIDPQGFIKKASPIVNITPNGTFTTNDESEGTTVTRVAQGEYLIEGVLGFNSDAGWGGVDGGIEIPLDINKQPLIWVNSKVNKDGSILVKTYHRTHPNAPKFARNDIDGFNDGDPIDIPDGRFISVRVQMPEQSIYNVRMREMEEAQKAEEERRQKEEEENQDTNKTPEIDN